MLVRCLYASRISSPLPAHALDEILDQSRRNNAKRGITGLLCHTNDGFVQVLEGGRDAIAGLLAALFRDTRHNNMTPLLFEEVDERSFGIWTMGRVDLDAVNPALLLKYSETAALQPFRTSGRATMSLLLELISSGAIVSRPGGAK
jgi:hypothetical protein